MFVKDIKEMVIIGRRSTVLAVGWALSFVLITVIVKYIKELNRNFLHIHISLKEQKCRLSVFKNLFEEFEENYFQQIAMRWNHMNKRKL